MAFPVSSREREVLQLVLAGKSNKEIGSSLNLSPKTVGSHLNKIYKKLEVHSRAQLYSVVVGGTIVGDDFHSLDMRLTRIEAILLQLGFVLNQCTATDNPVGGIGSGPPPPAPVGTNSTSTQ
jgi:DNA-binding CsgD family transcriptional regulator